MNIISDSYVKTRRLLLHFLDCWSLRLVQRLLQRLLMQRNATTVSVVTVLAARITRQIATAASVVIKIVLLMIASLTIPLSL